MSANQAPTILALIASVAVTSWLYAAFYLANSPALAAKRGRTEPGKADPESGLAPGPTMIVGAGAVEGEPAALSARLGAKLARGGIWPGGPIAITERRDDLVRFATPGEPGKPSGEIRLTGAGPGRTRYEYAVEYRGLAAFLRWGWVVQAAGLIVLAVGYWALRTYVATNANPAIRAQSFQLIQVVHLLWPPFLLGYRYRAQYRLIRRQMDSLLINLPHASE